jgi:formate dehydrogenase beta subunit
MRAKPNDMTPVVDLTREKGTGPSRTRRPIYVDLLPPCNNACPAGEHFEAWLAVAQAGKYRDAWEVLVRDNPMPAVQAASAIALAKAPCNRTDLDAAVSIHAVERFLGDLASRERWQQAKQPLGIRLQLLARLTLNAGEHPGNQPTRLAHLDRGNDRAILV